MTTRTLRGITPESGRGEFAGGRWRLGDYGIRAGVASRDAANRWDLQTEADVIMNREHIVVEEAVHKRSSLLPR